jgi:predicted Ser/Thr protein kinase
MPKDDVPPPTPDGVPMPETLAGEPLSFGQLPTIAPRAGEQPTLPAPPALPAAVAARVPGYEILRELGRGGMGVVYLARQEGLDRAVALKMILHGRHAGGDELGRFRAEAQSIARLKHPNIVQIYDFGAHDDLPYFAMEYCAGDSLARAFAERRPSPRDAAHLVARLARALGAAHAAGIVHRDLKPANVLMGDDGSPKITDFGLAKQLGDDSGLTRSGTILGTPSYMAPEQAAGDVRSVGPAADVWALGAVLYDALTGRPPFRGATAAETLDQVRHQEPVSPRRLCPDLAPDLEAVALKCLEKHPGARYTRANDLADDLERWLRGEPVAAHRRGFLYRAGKRLRRHRWKVVASAAAVAALAIVWLALADAGYPVPAGLPTRRWLDRRATSLFRAAPTADRVRTIARDQRRALLEHLRSVTILEGWFLPSQTAKGQTDAWTQWQTGAALLESPEAGPEEVRRCVATFSRIFEPNGVCEPFVAGYGWPNFHDGEPSTEASAWALSGLAAALAGPHALAGDERRALLERLAEVQAALDACQTRDPQSSVPVYAWNLFARQDDPSRPNIYITGLVFRGLVALRLARLPWRDSEARRDELLAGSLTWLLAHFDGQGWSAPGRQEEEYSDGLTLQATAFLLWAEAAGVAELPEKLLARVPELLEDCGTRPLTHPVSVPLFSEPFTNPLGKRVPRPSRPVRLLWHPWAVDCAARWLARCERRSAPRDEIVQTRRVLGHLVLDLGGGAVADAKTGFTYVTTETLIGLEAAGGP